MKNYLPAAIFCVSAGLVVAISCGLQIASIFAQGLRKKIRTKRNFSVDNQPQVS